MKNRLLQEWRCTVDAFMPSDAQKCSGHLWLSLVIKSDMQVRKCELNKKGKKEKEGRKKTKQHPLASVLPFRAIPGKELNFQGFCRTSM